ncbi:hypothetical protein [Sphingosinicella sp.]|uniref:hypothetical protein n=1 Tax=Sphingosinicella sp. TaxID=1917971 RepID=UPI004037B398
MTNPFSTRRRVAGRRALLAACCGVTLVAAQAPTPPAEAGRDPIIVEGERLTPAAARERAAAFIRATGVAASETPAARWTDPVCPRVLGLAPAGARTAENMIRAIAIQVGAEVAPEPCDSNIVVSFASDAGAVVREIERREPRRFGELDPAERRALIDGDAPIRWWHTSEERDTSGGNGGQGRSATANVAADTNTRGAGAGSDLANDVPTTVRYSNSLISTYAQRSLLSATVVIDQDAVMGRRLGAVAAYAALVALAEIRPVDVNSQGSILSLFTAASPPNQLTAQDVGFLRTLYRLPLDRQARYHRGSLVAGMISATTGN